MPGVHVPARDDGAADGDTASACDVSAVPDLHMHASAVLEAHVLLPDAAAADD